MLRQDDFIRSQFVLTAWRHGLDYGGHIIPLMIMGCLMNRVRLGWGSHLEVIERIPQFSATLEQPNANKFPSIWEPNFVRLLHEVEAVYSGSGEDKSKGALYWCDTRNIETDFFKNKIIGNMDQHPRIVECNSFVLFR